MNFPQSSRVEKQNNFSSLLPILIHSLLFISCMRYVHSPFSHSNTRLFLPRCKDSKQFYIGLRPQNNNRIQNEICVSGSTKHSIKHHPQKGQTLSRPNPPYSTQMLKANVHCYIQPALPTLNAGRTYHVVLKKLEPG
jgi:hypothetical protein